MKVLTAQKNSDNSVTFVLGEQYDFPINTTKLTDAQYQANCLNEAVLLFQQEIATAMAAQPAAAATPLNIQGQAVSVTATTAQQAQTAQPAQQG